MYKVLVVEDEEIIRRGLIRSVDWASYNLEIVGEANNGKEALSMISKTFPDIIILDINMPILDGIELLNRLPSHTYSIIILSGHSEFEYAQQAIKHGVVDYLLKPIDQSKFLESLEKAKRNVEYLNTVSFSEGDKYRVLEIVDKVESITLTKVLNYIDENYSERITLEDLEEVTNKSSTSINSRFQRHLNTTFSEYLTLYRMQKAVDLIKDHEYHMYEIAEMVGYSDYKYFNKVFNKVLGVPSNIVRTYYSKHKQNEEKSGEES